ncbi:MAG TPA: GNAT family N-acetyltransferase [Candidatus Binataceae bacterium]|nr:GNAT family N-acetyltransferase [Candidatus Binataceae bacterium]
MTAARVRVEQLSTREGFERFAKLPYEIYAGRDAWWPPDVQNEVDLLAGRALITAHLDLQPLGAWRDGKLVARVSAVVNHRYNEHWREKLGQLIHFEALPNEDQAVAAMLEEALTWLARRGMAGARSGFAAFLDYPYAIDGYGELSSFLLRGNPEFYHRYFKNSRFFTEKGQVDYTASLTPELLERYSALEAAAGRAGVRLKSWREYGFLSAIDAWTDVINAAFDRHWGWNPITREEVRPMLMPMQGMLVAELSIIAELDGAPVGAVFAVPDFTALLAQVRPGVKLRPERGGGTRGALINVGVLPQARSRGIAAAMAARSFLAMARNRMKFAGYTLVLDDNWPSRRTAENLGAQVTGNFVTYRRAL